MTRAVGSHRTQESKWPFPSAGYSKTGSSGRAAGFQAGKKKGLPMCWAFIEFPFLICRVVMADWRLPSPPLPPPPHPAFPSASILPSLHLKRKQKTHVRMSSLVHSNTYCNGLHVCAWLPELTSRSPNRQPPRLYLETGPLQK